MILPGWVGLNAGDEFARRLNVHVDVDNDANLGALGEHTLGAGRGLRRRDLRQGLVRASAPGIVLGGRLHRGVTGNAGEIGHVQVRPDGVGLPLRQPRLPRDGRLGDGRFWPRCARSMASELDMSGLLELAGRERSRARCA